MFVCSLVRSQGPAAACLFVAGMADDTDEAALTALFDRLTARGALKTKLRADRSARRYAFVQLYGAARACLSKKFFNLSVFFFFFLLLFFFSRLLVPTAQARCE